MGSFYNEDKKMIYIGYRFESAPKKCDLFKSVTGNLVALCIRINPYAD